MERHLWSLRFLIPYCFPICFQRHLNRTIDPQPNSTSGVSNNIKSEIACLKSEKDRAAPKERDTASMLTDVEQYQSRRPSQSEAYIYSIQKVSANGELELSKSLHVRYIRLLVAPRPLPTS